MTGALNVETLDPPHVVGGEAERASKVIGLLREREAPIRHDAARARLLLEDRAIRSWVDASIAITAKTLSDEVTYLEATADALDVQFEALFLAQNRSLFRVEAPGDDCTVGAARLPEGSAWVVKNRDNKPDGRHILVQYTDDRWGHSVLAHSNYGGPIAASSGVNTRGLGAVITRTIVQDPPPGIYRGSLMSALLAKCGTVEEALDMTYGLPHLGGTITLGDRFGTIATVELEPDALTVEMAGHREWLAKTNHPSAQSVVNESGGADPEYLASSKLRLLAMQQTMSQSVQLEPSWPVIESWIASRMSSHDGDGAPCRHGKSPTVNTAVILCDPPTMLTSVGPPCEGQWQRWSAELV
ncbi:C45 family autoproteolytic acyltransferase/hydolase [Leucobacter denitrificans]|uniref:Peptidase C45 hydrolase domain-containing protein n=1 Tax=Leucobacter denitrificans TaxID=683042 RepID=A0A7G9S320_9MICO|nr:C45 family peptidase [Leucobacter denitrificans]QNN62245.1 hypothetical protein H9L06_08120 [Leucobacter denitrificans]